MTKINDNTIIESSSIQLKNLIPIVLYEGDGNGDITLNDNYTNYKYFEIYCTWYTDYCLPAIKIDVNHCLNSTNEGKFIVSFSSVDNTRIIYSKIYKLADNNKIKKVSFYYYVLNTGELATWDVLKIKKVIGYK